MSHGALQAFGSVKFIEGIDPSLELVVNVVGRCSILLWRNVRSIQNVRLEQLPYHRWSQSHKRGHGTKGRTRSFTVRSVRPEGKNGRIERW